MRTRSDLLTLYNRAMLAWRRKWSSHSILKSHKEDFAGWCAERWLSNKSQHSTIEQMMIDYLRAEIGSRRVKSQGPLNMAKRRLHENERMSSTYGKVTESNLTRCITIDEALRKLSREDQIILLLRHKWGLHGHDIGEMFDLCESAALARIEVAERRLVVAQEEVA